MTFTTHPFSGSTFFPDVRSKMTDRALFCGQHDDFRYVVMDVTFYRFEVFMRPATDNFVHAATAAQTLRSALRVVTNASHVHDYHSAKTPLTGPTVQDFEGEVITGHILKPGTPPSMPDHRYIGALDGATAAAIKMGKGDPSGVTSPGTFAEAIGRLNPILQNKLRFGPRDVYDSSGQQKFARSTNAQEWESRWDGCGKVIVGVHRATDIVFVLVQKDSYTGGLSGKAKKLSDVIDLLFSMGVDDAVIGDGSDSTTLVVDGTAEVTPGYYKDKCITSGFGFARWHLSTRKNSHLVRDAATTDPRFPDRFRLDGTLALLLAMPGGTVDLRFNSLGVSPNRSQAQIQSDLGVTMPLTLQAVTPQLTIVCPFSGSGVTANLALQPDVEGGAFDGIMVGTIRGTISFPTSQGRAVFRAILPMEFQAP